MAPLAAAILSTLDRHDQDSASYIGWFDNEWCIGSVPQGGYSLSVMLNSIQSFMRLQSRENKSKGNHFDPILISASYLAATTATVPYNVEIKIVKRGRGFTNLEAKIIQKSFKDNQPQTRISAHILMTDFQSREKDLSLKPTIPKNHKLFTKCPLSELKDCKESNVMKGEKMNMRDRLTLYEDENLISKGKDEGELKWGGWLQIAEIPGKIEESGMGNNNIPFFADMQRNPVDLLPEEIFPRTASWYPTMHLTIEFKRKIPYDVAIHRAGLFSQGRFIMQGQQDLTSEVWTHPEDNPLFDLKIEDGPQILCIAHQTALTFDLAINQGQNKKKENGEKANL